MTFTINDVSTILGIILSLGTILGGIIATFYKIFKKIDKIDRVDKIDEVLDKMKILDSLQENLKNSTDKAEERKLVLYGLKDEVHDIKLVLDDVTEETRFNTAMNKVDTEALEALADHAIKTQNANGKVHRSLEMIEKLKYNNPKFS